MLFLDEVARAPKEVQVKLLKAVEQGWIQPVGSDVPVPVDVWVLSGTNIDVDRPPEPVTNGRSSDRPELQSDLRTRLSQVRLDLPPLKDRPEDLLVLACLALLRRAALPRGIGTGFSPEAIDELQRQRWKGNLREASSALDKLVREGREDGRLVTAEDVGVVVGRQR